MQDEYIHHGEAVSTNENPAMTERIEKELAEYAASDELTDDIAWLKNDYECQGVVPPNDMTLMEEATAAHRAWICRRLECEANGHQFTEYADGENGRGTLDCEHCGYSFSYQW